MAELVLGCYTYYVDFKSTPASVPKPTGLTELNIINFAHRVLSVDVFSKIFKRSLECQWDFLGKDTMNAL